MRAATQRAVTFQSTPSLRRATRHHSGGADQAGVSIHALLAESDLYARPPACSTLRFNPRPPCGERLKFVTGNRSFMSFQSTPSLRRATYYSGGGQISGTGFNPRPPCGERRQETALYQHSRRFQSTPSLRRATGRQSLPGRP